jgi:hypothetical protein
MAPPKTEYAEFHLIDPVRLAQGVEAATVMTIGVLIRGLSVMQETPITPREHSRLVNSNIADLSHRKGKRAELQGRATEPGAWQFHYCSRCGRRLTRTQCMGCKRTYSVPMDTFGSRSLPLPRKVTNYAVQNRHQFEVDPPRP